MGVEYDEGPFNQTQRLDLDRNIMSRFRTAECLAQRGDRILVDGTSVNGAQFTLTTLTSGTSSRLLLSSCSITRILAQRGPPLGLSILHLCSVGTVKFLVNLSITSRQTAHHTANTSKVKPCIVHVLSDRKVDRLLFSLMISNAGESMLCCTTTAGYQIQRSASGYTRGHWESKVSDTAVQLLYMDHKKARPRTCPATSFETSSV